MSEAIVPSSDFYSEKKNNMLLVIIASSVRTLIEWYDLLLAVMILIVIGIIVNIFHVEETYKSSLAD